MSEDDNGVGGDPLTRIAAALERLAPPLAEPPDWTAAPAYVWTGDAARPVARIDAPALALLRGIDAQKALVTQNVARLASGSIRSRKRTSLSI